MAKRTLGDVARETAEGIIRNIEKDSILGPVWSQMPEDRRAQKREQWEELVLKQGDLEQGE